MSKYLEDGNGSLVHLHERQMVEFDGILRQSPKVQFILALTIYRCLWMSPFTDGNENCIIFCQHYERLVLFIENMDIKCCDDDKKKEVETINLHKQVDITAQDCILSQNLQDIEDTGFSDFEV